MPNVGGVADLAHLAVADDVHTRLHLLAHDVVNRLCNGLFEKRDVVVGPGILSQQTVNHSLGSGQAAHVGNGIRLSHLSFPAVSAL
jgi:hypothetical protein